MIVFLAVRVTRCRCGLSMLRRALTAMGELHDLAASGWVCGQG